MTKEQALALVKKYIDDRKRQYDYIVDDPVRFETDREVIHGKYKGEERDLWTVCYEVEGLTAP